MNDTEYCPAPVVSTLLGVDSFTPVTQASTLPAISPDADLHHGQRPLYPHLLNNRLAKLRGMEVSMHSCRDNIVLRRSQPHMPFEPLPVIISLTRHFSTQSFEYTLIGLPITPLVCPSPWATLSKPSFLICSWSSTCCSSVR